MSANSSCCETFTSESDCKCSGEIELAWAFPVICVEPKRLEAEPWDEISSNMLDRLSFTSPEGSVSILVASCNLPGIRPLAETSTCCCSAQFRSCPAEPPGGEFWSMVGCSSSQSPPKSNNIIPDLPNWPVAIKNPRLGWTSLLSWYPFWISSISVNRIFVCQRSSGISNFCNYSHKSFCFLISFILVQT